MLTFLHLSDLHITTQDADTQFDRDVKIRRALLDDLGIEGRTNFDAILVTGDTAYHGSTDEFLRAKAWFEEVRSKTSSNPEALFVVPGNHDVNQTKVAESSALWDLHQILRNPKMTPEARNDKLRAKLKDKSLDFLAALREYSVFAQEYGCPTTCEGLAWVQYLTDEKELEDGTVVRFHGLNSALLSDNTDAKGNLLLSSFQFEHFDSDPRYVNVVLCHHPHNWLIDDNASNDYFRNQAHLLLSGHEHDARCYIEGGCLRVRAGATHPNRQEGAYEPCYHVIRLSIDSSVKRELSIQVETRVWREKEMAFFKYVQSDGSSYYEQRVPLKAWTRQPPPPAQFSASAKTEITASSATGMTTPAMTPDTRAAARRKLIVHFFRLGTLSRLQAATKAGVWEDGDDGLEGQERWARVFDRAEKNNRLGALWDAIASEDVTLSGQNNPYTSTS